MNSMHFFRRIHLLIPLCEEQHVHSGRTCQHTSQREIIAFERVGCGLAIQRTLEGEEPAGYTLLHLASGRRVAPWCVATVVQAGRWLRAVAPLFDWTQPLEVFFQPHPGLATQVEQACLEATDTALQARLW